MFDINFWFFQFFPFLSQALSDCVLSNAHDLERR